MNLTEKDKIFLETLKALMDDKELFIELKEVGAKRLVLRKNYGDRLERAFGLTRQGVRWRFQRLFNQIYIQAYISICWIESQFGAELRSKAMAIAREQMELRRTMREHKAQYGKHENRDEFQQSRACERSG